jgi:ParB family chromosome partitioning protein
MALKQKGGLGRGLDALLGGETQVSDTSAVKEVNINEVEPGDQQPRRHFDEEKLDQLAESIKDYGIIDPLIVKREGNVYKIIAGERRWRAARKAGLKKVPIIERDSTTREVMEIALIENVQRTDLNPIEEAEAYEKLMKEYDLTQDQIAMKVGKNRATIANMLRLLNFEPEIRELLISGAITQGQARPILALEDSNERILLAQKVVEQDLSARQVEECVKKIETNRKKNEENETKSKDLFDELAEITSKSDIKAIQNELKSALGTKVKLADKNGKGKIVIEYYSADERERLIDLLKNK